MLFGEMATFRQKCSTQNLWRQPLGACCHVELSSPLVRFVIEVPWFGIIDVKQLRQCRSGSPHHLLAGHLNAVDEHQHELVAPVCQCCNVLLKVLLRGVHQKVSVFVHFGKQFEFFVTEFSDLGLNCAPASLPLLGFCITPMSGTISSYPHNHVHSISNFSGDTCDCPEFASECVSL